MHTLYRAVVESYKFDLNAWRRARHKVDYIFYETIERNIYFMINENN